MKNSRRQFLFPVIILIILISAGVLTACAPGYDEVLFEAIHLARFHSQTILQIRFHSLTILQTRFQSLTIPV